MKDLLCLVHVATIPSKRGMPIKSSYSYRYKNCKCDNCTTYKQYCGKMFNSKNKEKNAKRKKAYYKKNKKEIRERQIIYELKNIEKVKQYKAKYHKEHKDKSREAWRRREALKRGNGFKKYTEKQVLKKYGTICYLWNNPIDLNAARLVGKPGWQYGLHIEHVIDIALGGPDSLENVWPSHGICNLKKKPREMV